MNDDDKRCPHPASVDELRDSLSFALRYDGRKRVHTADDVMAHVKAERLVRHLQQSGYVHVMRNIANIIPLEESWLSSCRCRSAGRS